MQRSSRQRIDVRSTSGMPSAGHASRRGALDCGRSRAAARRASSSLQSWKKHLIAAAASGHHDAPSSRVAVFPAKPGTKTSSSV